MDTQVNIIDMVEADPAIVITQPEKLDLFLDAVKANAENPDIDLSTDKGRKAIASAAHRVTRQKTSIDKAGMKLNEDAQAKIKEVNAVRNIVKTEMDSLRDQIRKPLSDWEKQEEAWKASCEATVRGFDESAIISHDDTSKTIAERLKRVEETAINQNELQEWYQPAKKRKTAAVEALNAALVRITKEEADKAELAELRAKQIENDLLETERQAKEKAAQDEADRKQREVEATNRAAEQARIDAETKAEEELAAKEREHQAELDRIRKEQQEAEQARVQKVHDEKLERERIEAEAQKKQANQRHRKAVMAKAAKAMISYGKVDAAQAEAIVLSISAGSIPNIQIQF